MRFTGLLLLMSIIVSSCGNADDTLPTALELPPTKTLIPTQSQNLTTPTLPNDVNSASVPTVDSTADANTVPADTATNASNETNATSADTSGDTVSNPSTDTPVDCNVQDGWFEYTVQRGDNLANIASRTGSTIEELTVANCLENPNRIRPNQVLFVPNDPSPQRTPIPSSIASTDVSAVATDSNIVRTPAVSASLKKTYENEKGFAFDYPADWFITESQTSTVDNIVITSFEYTAGVEIPQNRWTDDMVSTTVTIFQNPSTVSLSEWTQTASNQFQNAANLVEVFLPVAVVSDSGVEGQSIDYVTDDDAVIRNYYFIINGHQVQINVGGNLTLAESIINSLVEES